MDPDYILNVLIAYKYWMFIPMALVVGGPVVALLAGLMTSLGYLAIVPTYAMLILCDLIPDTAYYFIGRQIHMDTFLSRYGKRMGMDAAGLKHIDTLWKKHTFKSMAFSKWAYGFSTPLLMSAGLVRLSFRKYLIYTLSITMVQYIILFCLGYYSGAEYHVLINHVHNIQYLVAGIMVAFIVGYLGFSLFIKRRFLREQQEIKHS